MTNNEDREVRREIIRRINRIVCAADVARGAYLEIADQQSPLPAIRTTETEAAFYAYPD
jgi:hypothetical protein